MRDEVLIVGDVGGTHARLGTVLGDVVGYVEKLVNDDHPSFEALVRRYLDLHPPGRPVRAAVAIAAPMIGDRVAWTNRDWSFSARELATQLGLVELRVLNDFQAVAHALPVLDPRHLVSLGGAEVGAADRPRAVLGPGTGLGLAALLPHGDAWFVLSTEGGHAGLAPGPGRERAVTDHLRGGGRLAAEPVLSGQGLVRLHDAIRAVDGLPPREVRPEHVTAGALEGDDPVSLEAVELFCRLLGRFAGDATLTLGARGGVYLVSAICRLLQPFLQQGGFREAFEDKDPMRAYVQDVPTWIVTERHVALLGAAAALGARPTTIAA